MTWFVPTNQYIMFSGEISRCVTLFKNAVPKSWSSKYDRSNKKNL